MAHLLKHLGRCITSSNPAPAQGASGRGRSYPAMGSRLSTTIRRNPASQHKPPHGCVKLSLLNTSTRGCGRPTYQSTQEFGKASFSSRGQAAIMNTTTAMMEKPPHTRLFRTLCSFRKMSLSGTGGALSSLVQKNVPTWPPIDKSWWRDLEVLLSICELKTKEVNGHDREQHQASDGRIQLITLQTRRHLTTNTFAWGRRPVQYNLPQK